MIKETHTRNYSFTGAGIKDRPYCSEPVTATNLSKNHVTFGTPEDMELVDPNSMATTTNLKYMSKDQCIMEEIDSEYEDSSRAQSELDEFGNPKFRKGADYTLNVPHRKELNRFFNAWIDHHLLQKRLWQKMVKTRCHLQNLRLNRFMIGWRS